MAKRKLSQLQAEFTHDVGKLIVWANKRPGVTLTMSDARSRPGNKPTHSATSFHYRGLAIDLNLFLDGVYQTSTKAHTFLGEKWKKLRDDNTWGGDFSSPDGNHYSKGEGRRL